jgi:hypothetical protein
MCVTYMVPDLTGWKVRRLVPLEEGEGQRQGTQKRQLL